MTDRFDEGKRALESTPAHDVWEEAEHRAATGTVVPLTPAARPPRRVARWLAAAAVVALVAGTVAVLADDGDSRIDAGSGTPTTPDPAVNAVTTYQAGGGCKIGIRGEPLPGPSTSAFTSPDGTGGTMLVGHLNDVQQYAVHAPGQAVIDLLGERVEDVQLQRGTAQIWFQQIPNDAVQVRWFPGRVEPCDSFTVSVESGAEDENRHAAVDLAERLVVASELPGCCEEEPPVLDDPLDDPLADTLWQLERSTVDGEPTEGVGSRFSFTDAEISWSDGCNEFTGYRYAMAAELIVIDADGVSSDISCAVDPTTSAIATLLVSGRIAWSIDERGFLVLEADGIELVLRPADLDAGDPGGPEASGVSTTTSTVPLSTTTTTTSTTTAVP